MSEQKKGDYVIELCWHGPRAADLEPQIEEELRELLDDGLPNPAALILHNVILGELGDDNPVVLCWGVEGDHRFHCEYMKDESHMISFEIDEFPNLKNQIEELKRKKALEEKK